MCARGPASLRSAYDASNQGAAGGLPPSVSDWRCAGRGKCINYFCQCEPPYFSLGCSRSKAYPPERSQPSPTEFKIYMYELPTWLAWDQEVYVGWRTHDQIYTAYNKVRRSRQAPPASGE